MAIHLITGVPGAGKSLRAVHECVKRIGTKDEQDRPVFGNIRGFRRQAPLPGSRYQNSQGEWEDIPGTWMDCPDGSIICIDEVQERWRRYRTTGEPPPEIAALERHRHRNIDFIITCQNPKQLSDDVRSLVDIHEHLQKKTKKSATVYRWRGRCSTSPHSGRREADCETGPWIYPKWVFAEYVSADAHTVRTKIPRLYYYVAAALVALPVSLVYAYSNIKGLVETESVVSEVPAQPVASVEPARVSHVVSRPEPEPETVTATAYAGGVLGETCRLYDMEGKTLLVSRPECLQALDRGLPYDVELLDL